MVQLSTPNGSPCRGKNGVLVAKTNAAGTILRSARPVVADWCQFVGQRSFKHNNRNLAVTVQLSTSLESSQQDKSNPCNAVSTGFKLSEMCDFDGWGLFWPSLWIFLSNVLLKVVDCLLPVFYGVRCGEHWRSDLAQSFEGSKVALTVSGIFCITGMLWFAAQLNGLGYLLGRISVFHGARCVKHRGLCLA
jgi:hypothetical protein